MNIQYIYFDNLTIEIMNEWMNCEHLELIHQMGNSGRFGSGSSVSRDDGRDWGHGLKFHDEKCILIHLILAYSSYSEASFPTAVFRQTLLGRRFASLKHVTRARPDDCLRRFPVCGINKPRDLAEFRCRIRYRLGRNSGFTFRRPTFALHGRLQACKHATIGKSVICNGAARWKWKQWCSRFLIQLYEWYESSPTYTT